MRESKTIEFKREYTENLKYEVIAFANTDGGTIYIGIEDDGTVIGIENTDKTMLSITNMIRDSIHPDVTLFTDVNTVDIEEKTVIRIDILRGTERPYYIKGKGIRPEGIYVRQGASSVPASHAAIVKMIKETSSDNFEEAISIEQTLSFSKADEAFRNHSINFDDNNKRTLGLIRHDGLYTNLALLLSDQCPHSIKAARFQGTDKAIFTDRVEISGSVFQQMDEAYEYLQKNNRVSSEFKGLERVDHLDYPEEALRESLINAVVHREYAIPGPVLISIFDDRIEITALGGLTKELSLDDIMLGVSVLRNKKLGDIFYRLKLIEAYGTGIEKIMRSYDNCSEKPKIDISDNAFKITLPNQNYHKNTTNPRKEIDYREQTIMDLFKEKETIARKDIQEALDVSQATAILLARDLVEKDILLKESGGKYLRYRLNEIKK
ncbi:MAG: putative DNA binding domain-containing protein [Spirochaetes bacterium]|uniref:DNA binding domain-containing protein n=1 Tax=Candidatus Ornithospirochaeta stercoravium TaxID=2840897 RepID=A0A9D9IAF9_9SPIO|nr:putative DNA binding domain-containing protein [Candidatus Ornithospirochaeta stercoravium]